jgi:hypothetical protein
MLLTIIPFSSLTVPSIEFVTTSTSFTVTVFVSPVDSCIVTSGLILNPLGALFILTFSVILFSTTNGASSIYTSIAFPSFDKVLLVPVC